MGIEQGTPENSPIQNEERIHQLRLVAQQALEMEDYDTSRQATEEFEALELQTLDPKLEGRESPPNAELGEN